MVWQNALSRLYSDDKWNLLAKTEIHPDKKIIGTQHSVEIHPDRKIIGTQHSVENFSSILPLVPVNPCFQPDSL
jgi:hypothetical protein